MGRMNNKQTERERDNKVPCIHTILMDEVIPRCKSPLRPSCIPHYAAPTQIGSIALRTPFPWHALLCEHASDINSMSCGFSTSDSHTFSLPLVCAQITTPCDVHKLSCSGVHFKSKPRAEPQRGRHHPHVLKLCEAAER